MMHQAPSSYVRGVPSSKQEEAIAHSSALRAQQQAIAQSQATQQPQQSHNFGQGLVVRVPLQQLPQHLLNKPAFYDASRGIFFDGHHAYCYQAVNNEPAVTAIEPDGHQQIFGKGYGTRVPLIRSLQQKLYQGKPAFYDPVHGVYYDGKQAYLYVPTDDTSTAIELSGQSGQHGVQFGQGYGERVLLSSDIAPQLQGKPAFYDSNRGILYDGQHAYGYQVIQPTTAIELSSQQHQPASNPQQRAYYQQLVRDMNSNGSVYLFAA